MKNAQLTLSLSFSNSHHLLNDLTELKLDLAEFKRKRNNFKNIIQSTEKREI